MDGREHALGLVRIPEESGPWAFEGCPDSVTVAGRTYRRTGWPMLHHPGVICQYRETYSADSRHLYVTKAGTWVVDHIDRWNPDAGMFERAAHLVEDVPTAGTWIGLGILAEASVLALAVVGWLR